MPGKTNALLCKNYIAVALVMFVCEPAIADFDGRFPGKGSRKSFYQSQSINIRARAAQKGKKLRAAEQLFKQAITVYPYEPVLYFNLGRCLLDEKKYKSAESAFLKSLSLQENFANNMGMAAALYSQSKRPESKKYVLRALPLARTAEQKKMVQINLEKLSESPSNR